MNIKFITEKVLHKIKKVYETNWIDKFLGEDLIPYKEEFYNDIYTPLVICAIAFIMYTSPIVFVLFTLDNILLWKLLLGILFPLLFLLFTITLVLIISKAGLKFLYAEEIKKKKS